MVRGRTRQREAGLTLVELMVTMVIASLVASSTFVFFAGQQRIYETQTKILNVQQNLWAAMETLSRFVRASGTGMNQCVKLDPAGDPPPTGPLAPATGLRAFRNGVGVIRIAPLWIQNGAAGGTDTLTLAFGNGTTGNFSDAPLGTPLLMTNPTAAVTLPVHPASPAVEWTDVFRLNEFMVVLNTAAPSPLNTTLDRGCTLYQITGIDRVAHQLQHTNAGSAWNPPVDLPNLVAPQDYTTGANAGAVRNFGQLNWVQFSIAPATAASPPQLMMNRLDTNLGPQVLAEGIENLQIAYACDLQPAGTPDGVLSEGATPGTKTGDEWVYNVPADPVPVGCIKPQAIRITLVARTLTADSTLSGITTNAMPAVEDGVAGAPDTFRHRVLTTTVFPRN